MSDPVRPRALRPGDTLGVCAPSGFVTREAVDRGAAVPTEGAGPAAGSHSPLVRRRLGRAWIPGQPSDVRFDMV